MRRLSHRLRLFLGRIPCRLLRLILRLMRLILWLLLRLRLPLLLIKPVIIFLLLDWRQRLMKHLQLHCHVNVFSGAKPKDQFITDFHALRSKPASVIKASQFIHPLFLVFFRLQFLQHFYLFVKRHVVRIVKLVF